MALWVFQGNVVYIGMRQLSKLTGLSPATVMRRIRDLVDAGHLAVKKDVNGKRSWYELLSPVFAQKQVDGMDETVSYPQKRLVSVRKP